MYSPCFRLKCFETISDDAKFGVMHFLLEGLIAANIAYLLRNPRCPPLYQAGVRYEVEPEGRDEWQDIPDTLMRRNGDCEDLACWRVAELRMAGERSAKTHVTVSQMMAPSGAMQTVFHIQVRRANGSIEDPSRMLGMR